MEKETYIKKAKELRLELEKISTFFKGNVEYQYIEAILNTIIDFKELKDRTGVGILYGGNVTFTHIGSSIPKLIGKKVFPKLAAAEMLWFLQGKTDKESLNKLGVHYWDKFFRKDNTIGKSYGYQFRNGKDQVRSLIEEMLTNPYSRRLMINLWNVEDLDDMALPPCFYNYQFCLSKEYNTENWKVNRYDLVVSSRSADAFLGVPYNFLTSYFLREIILQSITVICDYVFYERGNIVWNIANFHIYLNHIEQCLQYCKNYIKVANSYPLGACINTSLPPTKVIAGWDFNTILENLEGYLITKDVPYDYIFSPKTEITIPNEDSILYNPEIIKAELAV